MGQPLTFSAFKVEFIFDVCAPLARFQVLCLFGIRINKP